MSFESLNSSQISDKIALVELDLPIVNDLVISYEAGIWKTVLTPEESLDGSTVLNPDRNTTIYYNIPSVTVIDGVNIFNYTKVTSEANLKTTNQSFWYDFDSKTIYFHFNQFEPILDRIVKVGVIFGFTNKPGDVNKSRYNDIYYEPRLKSIPSITFKKDAVNFGVLQFQKANFTFNNEDGFFDGLQFGINQVSRQEVRLKYGFDGLPYDDFELAYKAVIQDNKSTFTTYTLNCIDFREKLNRSAPYNQLSQIDYPDLTDDNNGAFIPIAYGDVFGAPTICLNEEAGSGNYTFIFCDTTHNASTSVTVYVDGTVVTPVSTDLNSGTFVLTPAQSGLPSSLNDVTCDFTGNALENPLDIIKDLSDNWGDIEYNSDNFDTTEWATETTRNDNYALGVYVDDPKKIIDVISDVCKSVNGIFFTNKEGLYTFRSYDASRSVSHIIPDSDWISDPSTTNPQKDFLSSVVCKYRKDIDKSKFRLYNNTDYEVEAVQNYTIRNSRTIETSLSNESSAIDFTNELMSISKDIVPNVKRTTSMKYFVVDLMDFVIASNDRSSVESDYKVWEVIGIVYNFNTFQITFTLRFVRDSDYTGLVAYFDSPSGGFDVGIFSI